MSARVALAAFLAALSTSAIAAAEPLTVWSKARDPVAARTKELVDEAEQFRLRWVKAVQLDVGADRNVLAEIYLARAKELLEQAGAATSRDPHVRFALAQTYFRMEDDVVAARLFEALIRDGAPAPIARDAWADLAFCYARGGRYADEIRAYDGALTLEPEPLSRASLLADRAEAVMAHGPADTAVAGYREALGLLTPTLASETVRMVFVTTSWGLAVALDRAGNLDEAFASIQMARAYDPADKWINAPTWFYVPRYDVHWYRADGFWARARSAKVDAARADAYLRAVEAWDQYLAAAPRTDPWRPTAEIRRRACDDERAAFVRAATTRGPAPKRALPRGARPPAPLER